MKRLLPLVFLFALPTFAATISGTVTPAGATVQAYDSSGILAATATADASGRYTLSVPAGSYRVLAFDPAGVYATSFYPDAESFDTSRLIDVQTSVSNINLTLVRGGTIAGTMTSGGAAVAGITVAAYNPDGTLRGFTRSDSVGHYQLVLPPGTYRLAAFDDSKHYLTSFYSDAASFDAATPVTVVAAQTTPANFRIAPGAHVNGIVTDAASGMPVENATVAFYVNGTIAATASTDSAGTYTVVLPPGTYRVVAFDPAGVYAATYVTNAESFDAATPFTFAAGDSKSVFAKLVRAGRITGHVSDAQSGASLAGITVAAFNADGSTRAFTTTDAAGNYTLVVPPGTYRVGAYDTALVYLRRFFPNELAFSAASPVSVFEAQSSSASLSLPRGAVVSGQITNSSLAVLSGITVSAYDASGLVASSTTDAFGHYRLLLEPGAYSVAVFDPSLHYATRYVLLSVAMGQQLSGVDAALVTGAHVTGSVTSEGGAPLSGITVAAYDGNGVTVSTAETGSGTFDLMLPPGEFRFAAYDAQHRYVGSALTSPYSLTAGQALSLTFRLAGVAPPRRRSARH